MAITIPGTRDQKNKVKQLIRFIPDRIYLKLVYWNHFGKRLNLKKPETFNEKMQWLKLYDRKPEYTSLVDKYEAKAIVASIIGEEYIIPTLGVWESFDDIPFDELPERFVLKCTHDSGGVFICDDRQYFDLKKARQKISSALKTNFFWIGREWPYKNVKPRVIAEEYISTGDGDDLLDYKMMCFSGKVKCSFVCSNRNSDTGLEVTFYDKDWNVMPFERHYHRSSNIHPKPLCYDEMVRIAEMLTKEFAFMRVDFYVVNNRPYFGELTFYPGSGLEEFTPEHYDYLLGSWIDCTVVNNI